MKNIIEFLKLYKICLVDLQTIAFFLENNYGIIVPDNYDVEDIDKLITNYSGGKNGKKYKKQ